MTHPTTIPETGAALATTRANAQRIADHQAEATAMQALGRPVTEVPSPLLVGMRLAQLDEVFWGRDWQEFVASAWGIWETSRAALVGMLAECGT